MTFELFCVKDHFLYNQVKSTLEYKGPVHAKSSIDKFMAEHQSPQLEAKIKKDLEKWSPILPGREIPDFYFWIRRGKSLTPLLKDHREISGLNWISFYNRVFVSPVKTYYKGGLSNTSP